MAGDVIKEFLVSLGFTIDERGYQRFNEGIRSATLQARLLADALESTARAVADATVKMAQHFEDLYYSSQRLGTSAREIGAFRYAIGQLGGTSAQAGQALETIGEHIRRFPGYATQLRAMGVDVDHGMVRLAESFARVTERMSRTPQGRAQALMFAQHFGFDENTMRAMWLQLADYQRFVEEYNKAYSRVGLNPDVAAEDAKKFNQAWRSIGLTISTIGDAIIHSLMQPLGSNQGSVLDQLNKILQDNGPAIAKALGDIAVAVVQLVGTFLKWLADPKADHMETVKKFLEFLGLAWLISRLGALALAINGIALALRAVYAAGALLFGAPWVASLMALFGFTLASSTGLNAGEDAKIAAGAGRGPGHSQREDAEAGRLPKAAPPDTRNWWQRHAPTWAGGQSEPRETTVRGRNVGHGGGRVGGHVAGTEEAMQAAMDQLRKEGVPEANVRSAAALLVGQAISESQLNPNAHHDTNTGFGIYGARNPPGGGRQRATEMINWLRQNGYADNSLEGQQRYMAHEAMTKYPTTRAILMGATPESLENDSWRVTKDFERPTFINDRRAATNRAYRSGSGNAAPARGTEPGTGYDDLSPAQKEKLSHGRGVGAPDAAPNPFEGSRYGPEGPTPPATPDYKRFTPTGPNLVPDWRHISSLGKGFDFGGAGGQLGVGPNLSRLAYAPPLGPGGTSGDTTTNEGDRSLTVSPTTTINVTGVSDPSEAARMIGGNQDRFTADMIHMGLGAIA